MDKTILKLLLQILNDFSQFNCLKEEFTQIKKKWENDYNLLKNKLDENISDYEMDSVISKGEEMNYQKIVNDEWLNNILIMFLGALCELKLKQGVYDFESNHREDIKQIKADYRKEYNINLEDINGYSDYDEIRLLYNCIKHDGFVNKGLASKNGRWKVNDKIILQDDEIEVYVTKLESFFSNLRLEIQRKIQYHSQISNIQSQS